MLPCSNIICLLHPGMQELVLDNVWTASFRTKLKMHCWDDSQSQAEECEVLNFEVNDTSEKNV